MMLLQCVEVCHWTTCAWRLVIGPLARGGLSLDQFGGGFLLDRS